MRNPNPEWQQEYLGRHVQYVPAEFAYGYQYRGPLADPGRVQRAIPADGAVMDPIPVPVPQVDLMMGRPHKWKKAVTRARRKRSGKVKNHNKYNT